MVLEKMGPSSYSCRHTAGDIIEPNLLTNVLLHLPTSFLGLQIFVLAPVRYLRSEIVQFILFTQTLHLMQESTCVFKGHQQLKRKKNALLNNSGFD